MDKNGGGGGEEKTSGILSTWLTEQSYKKFQLNWIRKQNFQFKLFNIDVTLKYSEGHWKCHEQGKLNE